MTAVPHGSGRAEHRAVTVPDSLAGERLDAAMARIFGFSRSRAAELVAAGNVTLDGHAAAKSERLLSGATLLEQAEAAGLTPEHGCRMGICFSCTTRKTEGTVRNVVTGVESARPDEDIQICVNQPVGDCAVEL